MQAIDRKEAQQYLNKFSFQPFFTELMGWNATPATRTIKTVERQDFHLTAIAEKRGYTVLLCDGIPPYPVRAKLDRLVSRDHFEHIIVFTDQQAKRQIWQVSLREKGQPVKLREVTFKVGTSSGEELIQKLQQIAVPLALEESIHLTDLTQAARAAFNREKVTKSFFKQFELEHKSFLKFLKGIPKTTEAWYVSVLINRLMFLYFMQSKSFLDSNSSYLTDKLKASTARKKDTFYRDFLCPLFFEGFALKKESRTPAVKVLLGDIPYLNGGLFQKHTIELQAEADRTPIVIPDAAFQQLFAFFDKWTWHLDSNENATGDEIDPDVLGYIFEKYINQKQMGAYYTKEDITGYIAQNTVLPFLFDTARKGCANAFLPDGAIWRMLRDDPDVYIYPAMRRGNAQPTRLELPSDIAAGLDNVSLRTGWNRPIPADFADASLPTETWREFIARRRRYDDLRTRIAAGEVHQVNDLVTLNLDIRQLALDAIQIAGSEDLVESLYKAIESVTILDPTCGSGAFLFAALELLQPLYQACLLRMQEFVDEAKTEAASKGKELHFNRFAHFRKTLDAAAKHVNIDYFILKTIIVQNLYGVDIMEEATEICKLRLFLKLVAQLDVSQKERIEPLPDIDFNIRPGNTLIGYVRRSDVEAVSVATMQFGDNPMNRIDSQLQVLDLSVAQFRNQQTNPDLGGIVSAEAKAELGSLFDELDSELDDFLVSRYVRASEDTADADADADTWKQTAKPFHWLSRFHRIIQAGGFDVIVGNPPYLEKSKFQQVVPKEALNTLDCPDIYAWVTERSFSLLSRSGRLGLIIPISITTAESFQPLRRCLAARNCATWLMNFANRPGQLFVGAQNRLSILLLGNADSQLRSSKFIRWQAREGERNALMQTLCTREEGPVAMLQTQTVNKRGNDIYASVQEKIARQSEVRLATSKIGAQTVYWVRVPGYFCQFFLDPPQARPLNGGASKNRGELLKVNFTTASSKSAHHAVLNSSTFAVYFASTSDGRHINPSDVQHFPFSLAMADTAIVAALVKLSGSLQKDFKRNTLGVLKSGLLIDSVDSSKSKEIIDEIDRVLAKHYGFTEEELDFIINYDIKYRMGLDTTGPDADA